MIKTFTRDFILETGKGCYDSVQAIALIGNAEMITLDEVLHMDIPVIDKSWFIRNICILTTKQHQLLALECAKVSLKIYEAQHPKDTRVRDCIAATEIFIEGKFFITRDELNTAASAAKAASHATTRAAAAAFADAAAYADARAAAAAFAAARAAAAADASAAAFAACAAAADASAFADAAARAACADKTHKENLLNSLINFCNNND